MRFALSLASALLWVLAIPNLVASYPSAQKPGAFDTLISRESVGLQDIVTWDEHTLFIRGERVFLFSAEFHPWRLPVTGLWLDVFQKIKAMGFNAVSFYVHWGLTEYKQGEFDFEGIRSYEGFFEAAKTAGIYLIARPGPYINAETAGGGFPGWGTRIAGPWRTANQTYIDAYTPWVAHISSLLAPHQITSGGPIILLQVENELTAHVDNVAWPQGSYMQDLIDKFRAGGMVVPTMNNDAWTAGFNAPGSGEGEVDIYAHDGYPNGFNCEELYNWPADAFPVDWWSKHRDISPNTPYSILEFQGGSFDDWGGVGYSGCSVLTNHEMVRVFYKNNFAHAVKIFNIYMTFGGTNWGGLAGPPVYTSYDYGAAITETREIYREKYAEMKLLAGFAMSSPAYLTSAPSDDDKDGKFTDNTNLWVTKLVDAKSESAFWVIRHSKHISTEVREYKLEVPTSAGSVSIPQLGSKKLSLSGRDSKIHLTDYTLSSGQQILYSSAEIYTHHTFGTRTIAIFYGLKGETHETAFKVPSGTPFEVVEGDESFLHESAYKDGHLILNYETSGRLIIAIGDDILVHFVDKNQAFEYWSVNLIDNGNAYSTKAAVLVKGPYLVRSAEITPGPGGVLDLRGDLNVTTEFEVIAPPEVKSITWNGQTLLAVKRSTTNAFTGTLEFKKPEVKIPVLKDLEWKYIDSFAERENSYNDAKWTDANRTETAVRNIIRPPTTPQVLYASEYGYHNGAQLWRGHFTATGVEKSFNVSVRGGIGFGYSVFLDGAFLGAFAGEGNIMNDAAEPSAKHTLTLPFPNNTPLESGSTHTITVVQDHMGLNEAWHAGSNEFHSPVGILDYNFNQASEKIVTEVTWKLTGNLGGEDYVDHVRGPFNEGGFYAERNGFHLPGYDTTKWGLRSPIGDGVEDAGIGFFVTKFDLSLPTGYDIPLSFDFKNTTGVTPANYRALLFVNGYQFGKYVNNLGPQTSYPVPEGILNHQGPNTVGLLLWSLQKEVVKLEGLDLVARGVYQSGFGKVAASPQPEWEVRDGY
ncbi:beta-galactosidase A [Peziza echinospora]|nr:beta-galactosidase A [Peziza echinospora]